MDETNKASMEQAVAQLGPGPLTEEGIARCIRSLFSRTLRRSGVYLAGHSLGRPLDQTLLDIEEGAGLWAERLREARAPWLEEEGRYRAALAALLGLDRPDCVVPKLSAGHALRAVLNTLPQGATVLTTEGEFSSVAVVLAQYAALGRLRVIRVAADADGRWTAACMTDALRREPETRLVVVSHVFYADGQVFDGLATLAAECRRRRAGLLVDAYHSLGAVPFTMAELGCDYVIGGCYKYLRGGEGAAFLALAPSVADTVRPLDTGWLALEPGTDPWAAGGPALRPGGDAWLEGSPGPLTYYQARSGLAFTRLIGVDRLRAYSLEQLKFLRGLLHSRGMESQGGDAQHGAFLTVATSDAAEASRYLAAQGITVDERAGRLRICPDVLTTRAELEQVASELFFRLRR